MPGRKQIGRRSSEALPQTVSLQASLDLTAKRLRPTAQGCRFGYPGNAKGKISNRKAVASFFPLIHKGRNRVAVGMNEFVQPRVAEAATLGFVTQPLCG